MREITEGLKPIEEGIEKLPQAIAFPAFPTITAADKETTVAPYYISDKAESYHRMFTAKYEADTTYGL